MLDCMIPISFSHFKSLNETTKKFLTKETTRIIAKTPNQNASTKKKKKFNQNPIRKHLQKNLN